MARKKSKNDRSRTRRGVEVPEAPRQSFGVKRQEYRDLPKQEARGTFKVSAALHNLRQDLPAGVLYEKKPRKPREPAAEKTRQAPKARSVDMTPAPTCKKRPDSRKKGSGASRSFVPYCK